MAAAAALHSALSTLCPVSSEPLLAPPDVFASFLSAQLQASSLIADSVPLPPAVTHLSRVRARSAASTGSEPDVLSAISSSPGSTVVSPDGTSLQAQALYPLWTPINLGKKNNELGFYAYKLPGKDGRGTWFARRSVHVGVGFDAMKLGLEREVRLCRNREEDGLRVSEERGPDAKKGLRGMGCERRLEKRSEKGIGKAEVLYFSAQFPGPMSPRDFCTLFLTSSSPHQRGPEESSPSLSSPNKPREFIIVSRPITSHPCLPDARTGFIRGQYESIEFIREVLIPSPEATDAGGQNSMSTVQAVEWVMVGRNDPGGSVPRWMVEKGTPMSIVKDAETFLEWVCGADGCTVTPGKEDIYISDDEGEQDVVEDDGDDNDDEVSNDDNASLHSFATAISHDSLPTSLAHSDQTPTSPQSTLVNTVPQPPPEEPTSKKLQSLLAERERVDQQIEHERNEIAALESGRSMRPPSSGLGSTTSTLYLSRVGAQSTMSVSRRTTILSVSPSMRRSGTKGPEHEYAKLLTRHHKNLVPLLKLSANLAAKYEKELAQVQKKAAREQAKAAARSEKQRKLHEKQQRGGRGVSGQPHPIPDKRQDGVIIGGKQPDGGEELDDVSLRKELEYLRAENNILKAGVQRLEDERRKELALQYLWRHAPSPTHCHEQNCDCVAPS